MSSPVAVLHCPSCWSAIEPEGGHCPECHFAGSPDRWLPTSPAGTSLEDGKYRLIEPLGAGGFGYAARAVQYCGEVALGSVAVKTLFRSVGGEERGDLVKEAATLRAASHPNLVTLHDAFVDHTGSHLVMEYVDGISLDREMGRREQLTLDFVIRIGVQIADGLNLLHSKGVVHCDLTPRNIALLPWLQPTPIFVKVLDFGIACRWEKGRGFMGRGAGTPGFSAPEQLLGAPTPRSDVFSLGALLYWMLTGTLPYHPYLFYEPERLLSEPVPDLDGRIPPELSNLVRRCLHPREEERWPAMPCRDLHRFQAAGLTEVVHPTSAVEGPDRDRKALLQIAKETFISAGLAKSDREKRELYLRSAHYFEEAEASGSLPHAYTRMAEKARIFAGEAEQDAPRRSWHFWRAKS